MESTATTIGPYIVRFTRWRVDVNNARRIVGTPRDSKPYPTLTGARRAASKAQAGEEPTIMDLGTGTAVA
jgi:hypothetical protein